jgi:hypothetical protein
MDEQYQEFRQVRMCTGKLPFEERAAKQRAKETGLRAYKCHYCTGWHLSSQDVAPEARAEADEARIERRRRGRRRRR